MAFVVNYLILIRSCLLILENDRAFVLAILCNSPIEIPQKGDMWFKP